MKCSLVFGRQLGQGAEGTVRLCTNAATGQQFACKTIPAGSHTSEVAHLLKLQEQYKAGPHPHIVNLHSHFQDNEGVHILLELCEGDSLLDRLHCTPCGRLSEAEAAQAFAAVCKGVSFCHENGIMHRDIKLENVLLPRADSPCSHAKLADFGAAADFSRTRCFTEARGTPAYIAPEVLTASFYDQKAETWSLGVLLHVLLSGYLPYAGETPQETLVAVMSCGHQPRLKEPVWESISFQAKSLVRSMLHRNPYRRPPVKQLLAHPWVLAHTTIAPPAASSRLDTSGDAILLGANMLCV